MKGRGTFCFAVTAFFLLAVSAVQGQVSQGWIEGRVRDSAFRGLEGVQVSVNFEHRRLFLKTRTDADGHYRLIALPPGNYTLEFSKADYARHTLTGVIVRSSESSIVDIQMKAGPEGTVAWRGHPAHLWPADVGGSFDRTRLAVLPSARSIWAVLEGQDPATVTNSPQEGGFTIGTVALAGVLGSSWTQNGYRLDGVNVTDPFETGKALVYPDYSSLQEIQSSSAFHSSEIFEPGGAFNLTSRSGCGEFHFGLEAYYLGRPLQGNTPDDRLRRLGESALPRFRQFSEGEFSASGHLPRTDHWFFFATLGIQDITKTIPEFSAIPKTRIRTALVRFDGNLTNHDQFTLMSTGQIVNQSHLGAGPRIQPSATLRGYDRFEVVQGHWTHYLNGDFNWEVLGGFSHSSPTDTIQRGVNDAARIDLFSGDLGGAAPLESDSARSRFSLVGKGQRRLAHRGLSQLLDFGVDLEESKSTEERRVLGGVQQLYFPAGVPSEVIEFNSPSHSKQRLRELSIYFEDWLKVRNRILIRTGLRFDSSNVFLPPQESQVGPFVPVRKFAGADSVVSWTTLSPRVGVSVPISRLFGGTRISGGYSRYYHSLPSAYANFANPTSLSGQVFGWNDHNKDGLFETGEEGTLLRIFGGMYSAVDPHLKRPFTDELTLGLDQDLGPGIVIRVMGFRRVQRRLVQNVDVGVPAASYERVSILDSGDDGIAGTSDDRAITVFNQDSGTLGRDRYILTNPPGLRSSFEGMQANLRANLKQGGFVTISFAAFKAQGRTNPGNTEFENDPGIIGSLFGGPNMQLNAQGRIFFDRAYVSKVAAYIRLPLGFYSGSVVRYEDGLPFGRKLIVTGMNQGPFYVMATPRGQPGGFRTRFDLSVDQRVARDFSAGRCRISLMIDTFNLLNRTNGLREYDLSGPVFPLRKPSEVQNPRAVRFGIRVSF